MDTYESVKVVRSLKRGGILVLRFTPIFQAYGLTGAMGVDILEKMKLAMWESKSEHPDGGLMGGMTALYGEGDPPHPAIDLLLAEILFIVNTRGAVAGVLDAAIEFLRNEGKTDLTKPWRECMIQVFQSFHKQIETEKNAMADLKSTLRGVGVPATESSPSGEEEDEDK